MNIAEPSSKFIPLQISGISYQDAIRAPYHDELMLERELRRHSEEKIARYEKQLGVMCSKMCSCEPVSLKGIDVHGNLMHLNGLAGGDLVMVREFKKPNIDKRIMKAMLEHDDEKAANLKSMKEKAYCILADVSGHDYAHALVGACLSTAVDVALSYALETKGMVDDSMAVTLNDIFCEKAPDDIFVCMNFIEVDSQRNILYMNCGMPDPVIYTQDSRIDLSMRLADQGKKIKNSMALGVEPSYHSYDDSSACGPGAKDRLEFFSNYLHMERGDTILFYSDGVIEHGKNQRPDYMNSGLLDDILRQQLSAEKTSQLIRDSLDGFAPRLDDISFLVMKF